jgi:uncharacterized membrane protein
MLFYKDPRDGRVFIPRQSGRVGLNYAHPIAWAILISMTLVPLVVVVATVLITVLN